MSRRYPKKNKSKHLYFYDSHSHNFNNKLKQNASKKEVYYYPRISESELRFGHSFIELFLVLLTMIVLVTVIIYLVKPSTQFADLRNTQRIIDISELQDALSQYQLDRGSLGILLGKTLPTCPQALEIGTDEALLDLSVVLVDNYIHEIPFDPQKGTPQKTGYTVCKQSGNRLRIDAIYAEKGATIGIIR